jgi:hypothetical protein
VTVARGGRTDDQLAEWAVEHLIYEVDMLVFALERLTQVQPETLDANLALESFAVHARCLFDFLWTKPNPAYDDDAFASDFSEGWNGRRDAIPAHLAEVRDRRRFGQEIFHLTYNRISGSGEEKIWLCGQMGLEIAAALGLFSRLARPAALDRRTRSRLSSIVVEVKGKDGKVTDEFLTLGHQSLEGLTGATTMDARHLMGGTINVRDLEVGS